MDLVTINSGETFSVDSRVEGLFPCRGSSAVAWEGIKDLQRVLFVLFTLARLECDLDCGGNWRDRKVDVWCYRRRWTRSWLRRDINLFPIEFVVVTVELWGIVMKVVHKAG